MELSYIIIIFNTVFKKSCEKWETICRQNAKAKLQLDSSFRSDEYLNLASISVKRRTTNQEVHTKGVWRTKICKFDWWGEQEEEDWIFHKEYGSQLFTNIDLRDNFCAFPLRLCFCTKWESVLSLWPASWISAELSSSVHGETINMNNGPHSITSSGSTSSPLSSLFPQFHLLMANAFRENREL